MKKFILILLNIIVLSSIGAVVYHFYIFESDSLVVVDCDPNYTVESNSMIIYCDVGDADSIISSNYPLTLYLYDEDNLLISEQNLVIGNNIVSLNTFDFNSRYSVSIDGYGYIESDYVETNYFNYAFSTVKDGVLVPTWTYTEILLTDTIYRFTIDVFDQCNCATSVDIILYNSSRTELLNRNYTDLENLEFTFTELNPENGYYIDININYIINDYNQSEIVLVTQEFITQKTLYLPAVEVLDLIHNEVNLSFKLITNDNDATEAVYTVELRGPNNNILYSEVTNDTNISLDVVEIVGDYFISIKASYLFNGVYYNDVELVGYSIFDNELSNFFIIPDLNIVDTSIPLSNYTDYDDYIYTFLNEGLTEFTIYCEAPVDCGQLVLNDTNAVLPFEITDLVHSYFDINEIGYSYSSTELHFVLYTEYTDIERAQINQEVQIILDLIITDGMTNYDKILAVHDYIVNSISYDQECFEDISTCDTDHTAIGVFFDDNAVCEGYSHAMDIMLRELYIPTFKVSSLTHQWNAVYLNGTWYHLDATWDDPITHNGIGILSHDFFLISSEDLIALDDTDAHTFTTPYIDFIN